MELSDFNYNLPKELIANTHIEPRDQSRLLVYDRASGDTKHQKFGDILSYLKKGDVLVFNNSKVFKARVHGKKETPFGAAQGRGGKIEILLVRNLDSFSWEVMVKGKLKEGDSVVFDGDLKGTFKEKKDRFWKVRFNKNKKSLLGHLEKHGEVPLPPYIEKGRVENSPLRARGNHDDFYQTVYAKETGSVAAPTAGFHFTKELLTKIKEKGVETLEVTLHVGPGTFLSVEEGDIKKHQMHEESFEISDDVWKKILKAKKEGRRVIAVGTTTCRVLESMGSRGAINRAQTKTDIFIYPPYEFQIVDALITNFHLPKSTLLMLVASLLDPGGEKGVGLVKKIYKDAVDKKYRFYSFGDSMFLK